MPTMYEIYDAHTEAYDRLVDAEDMDGNLSAHLHQLVDWRGKEVVEGGAGTGRVTAMYAAAAAAITCLDRAPAMLEGARRRLAAHAHKVAFVQGDNLDPPRLTTPGDVFVEGWSFGHSVIDTPGTVAEITDRLLEGVRQNLVDDGRIIIIETMGTATEGPRPPHERLAELYRLLEERHSFLRAVLRTDYAFDSVTEAAAIMGFFFGDAMALEIAARGATRVPEWTGVWIR